jgi:F-type H+-transporting ATPase subunit b
MYLLAFAEGVQLFPDGTLFLHILFILGMIWVLNRTLFRPINAILDARVRNQGKYRAGADEILEEVSGKQQQYEKTMLDARNESYKMIEADRAVALDAHQRVVNEAKIDAANRLANEKAQIKDKVAEAKVELALDANKMADRITANILNG